MLAGALVPGLARAQSDDLFAALVRGAEVGIERVGGEVVTVFGLPVSEAAESLANATRGIALPDGYRPRDLVSGWSAGLRSVGDQYVRAVVVPDTQELFRVAGTEGHSLALLSAYRSYSYQVDVFAGQVERRGDEEQANRWSARPGHSQHQLGTTTDFSGASIFRAFGESPEGQWFWENGHNFGYVFPYTSTSEPLTGYVPEPWHGRWVGRELALWMRGLNYQTAVSFCADDVVAAVRVAAGL